MANDETRQCPFCKEQINSEATKCKYCGSLVEPARPGDGRATFDYFMENVSRLLADQHFREVLRELDKERKETSSLLASDPAAFLRYRGVQIPQDFRISVKKTSKDAATHGGEKGHIIICDCVEVCFLRYCVIFCYCKVFENQQAASSLIDRNSFAFSEGERRGEMEKTPAPEASNQFEGPPLSFGAIETIVHQGKTVVSSENSAMVEWAIKAIAEGRTATLYVSKSVLQAILKRYWTPKRVEFAGLKPISAEQAAKVKSDFNIEIDGHANSVECPRCGHLYSTYEFIQQGIQEHGEEVVRSAFSFKGGIFQINPNQVPVCQNCRLIIFGASITTYITTETAGPSMPAARQLLL